MLMSGSSFAWPLTFRSHQLLAEGKIARSCRAPAQNLSNCEMARTQLANSKPLAQLDETAREEKINKFAGQTKQIDHSIEKPPS